MSPLGEIGEKQAPASAKETSKHHPLEQRQFISLFYLEYFMKRIYLAIVFIAVLTVFILGCRKPERPEGMPDLTPCIIVVTFGGEKIDGVGVQLHSQDPTTNEWVSGGRTDVHGKAVLKTGVYFDGAVPGNYIISFQKFAEQELSPDGMALQSKPLIPKKYLPNQSKETITVTKEQKEYVFELEGLK
jgi:hypothetical protein